MNLLKKPSRCIGIVLATLVVVQSGCGDDAPVAPARSPVPASLSIVAPTQTIETRGDTIALQAVVTDSTGTVLQVPVQWVSHSPFVASVSDKGLVTANQAEGTARISAVVKGRRNIGDEVTVEVALITESVAIGPDSITLAVGMDSTTIVPVDIRDPVGAVIRTASVEVDGPFTFTQSSDSSGLRVTLTAVEGGRGTLRVTRGGQADSVALTAEYVFEGTVVAFHRSLGAEVSAFIEMDGERVASSPVDAVTGAFRVTAATPGGGRTMSVGIAESSDFFGSKLNLLQSRPRTNQLVLALPKFYTFDTGRLAGQTLEITAGLQFSTWVRWVYEDNAQPGERFKAAVFDWESVTPVPVVLARTPVCGIPTWSRYPDTTYELLPAADWAPIDSVRTWREFDDFESWVGRDLFEPADPEEYFISGGETFCGGEVVPTEGSYGNPDGALFTVRWTKDGHRANPTGGGGWGACDFETATCRYGGGRITHAGLWRGKYGHPDLDDPEPFPWDRNTFHHEVMHGVGHPHTVCYPSNVGGVGPACGPDNRLAVPYAYPWWETAQDEALSRWPEWHFRDIGYDDNLVLRSNPSSPWDFAHLRYTYDLGVFLKASGQPFDFGLKEMFCAEEVYSSALPCEEVVPAAGVPTLMAPAEQAGGWSSVHAGNGIHP